MIHSSQFFTVHSLCEGKNKCTFTFTFIPGGPGLNAKCFEKFAKQYLSDFRVLAITPSGKQKSKMSLWVKDLEMALKLFPSDIVIGHSFGGMLALSSKKLPKLAKGLVLLSSAPNMDWVMNLGKFKISEKQINKINLASKKYGKRKNKENLQKLWASWAPYYFMKSNLKFAERWLLNQDYLVNAFESSVNLLKNYKIIKPLKMQILVLAGSKDRLTPIAGFKTSSFLKDKNLCFKILPKCAHFPWVENPKILASNLLSFKTKIKGST